MISWCLSLWQSMAIFINKERSVFDLCQQYANYEGDLLLPIHDLLPGKGANSIGTLLIFKKKGIQLAPCSKVQFFSDPDQVNLIQEISAGDEIKDNVQPTLLKHGRVWCYFKAGTNLLMSLEEQTRLAGNNSKLECAVVSIPKDWIIACWLTECLGSNSSTNKTV